MNEQNELIKKTITIASVESGTTKTGKQKLKLKDEKGLSYSVWRHKADGTESKAYLGLARYGLNAQGQTVGIMYKEEAGDFEGKAITYRTIVGFGEGGDGNKSFGGGSDRRGGYGSCGGGEVRQFQALQPQQSAPSDIQKRLLALEARIRQLEDVINTPSQQAPLNQTWSEPQASRDDDSPPLESYSEYF